MSKKQNTMLTKNGKPRLKAMSAPQIQKLIDQGTQKNATSKIGKEMAKLKQALCRKFVPQLN